MPGASVRIALVRHPETVANREGRYVGAGESPLTETGRLQLVSIAMVMEAWGPAAVLSSPRERALVTAKRISACGTPLTVLDDLAEIDFGRAEGLTWAEMQAVGMKMTLPVGVPSSAREADGLGGVMSAPIAPDGESWDAFKSRVASTASTIEGAASRVAVVTHGGVIRVLLSHWLGLPDDAEWHISLPSAVIATITLTDGFGVLESLLPPST